MLAYDWLAQAAQEQGKHAPLWPWAHEHGLILQVVPFSVHRLELLKPLLLEDIIWGLRCKRFAALKELLLRDDRVRERGYSLTAFKMKSAGQEVAVLREHNNMKVHSCVARALRQGHR